MEIYHIYTLEDPTTNIIRYVGYTKKSIEARLCGHLKSLEEAVKGTRKWNKRLTWIKSLKNKGLLPIIRELDSCMTKKEAYELEVYWINQLLQWGFPLTNMTIGGDGGDTFSGLTEESKSIVRNKISKKALGRTRTKEQIDNWRKTIELNGHWLTKLGAIHPMKGKKHNKETKLKLSKASGGRVFSEEQKNKLKGRIPHNKGASKYPGVIQSDENGFIEAFDTITLATTKLGLFTGHSSIVRCCKGKTKKAFGYFWKFKD